MIGKHYVLFASSIVTFFNAFSKYYSRFLIASQTHLKDTCIVGPLQCLHYSNPGRLLPKAKRFSLPASKLGRSLLRHV